MNGNHQPVGRPFQAVADGLERPSYDEIREARLTAYALGQLDGEEEALLEAELAVSPVAREEIVEIQGVAKRVRDANRSMAVPPSQSLRDAVTRQLNAPPLQRAAARSNVPDVLPVPASSMRRDWRAWAALAAAVCLLAAAAGLYLGRRDRAVEQVAEHTAIENAPAPQQDLRPATPKTSEVFKTSEAAGTDSKKAHSEKIPPEAHRAAIDRPTPRVEKAADDSGPIAVPPREMVEDPPPPASEPTPRPTDTDTGPAPERPKPKRIEPPASRPGPEKLVAPRSVLANTAPRGMRHLPAATPAFLDAYMSTKPQEITAPSLPARPKKIRDPGLPGGKFGAGVRTPGANDAASDSEGKGPTRPEGVSGKSRPSDTDLALPPGMRPDGEKASAISKNAETPLPEPAVPDEPSLDGAVENDFLSAAKFAYSAFSLEVDPRAYALVSRYLHARHLPRPDQVQIEDLVNYFDYDDPQPTGDDPFAVRVEAADCPWARNHRLVRIAIVGQHVPAGGAAQGRAGRAASRPLPIANDVRVQIQFNTARVASYRLIGYDSPPADEDTPNSGLATGLNFAAGQSVIALYEIVPAVPAKPAPLESRASKKQRTKARDLTAIEPSTVLLTVRLRYQRPGAKTYRLLEAPWTDPGQSFDGSSRDFRFSAAVAAFGMALRGSQYRGDISLDAIERMADSARGEDRHRAEFVNLVRLARQLGAGR